MAEITPREEKKWIKGINLKKILVSLKKVEWYAWHVT